MATKTFAEAVAEETRSMYRDFLLGMLAGELRDLAQEAAPNMTQERANDLEEDFLGMLKGRLP
jgi:hypothetical protein